jgi:hypothetical protein
MLTFSPIDKVMLSPLARYFSKVLRDGSLCIIIATPKRTRALSRAIQRQGVDIDEMVAGGQLIIINDEQMITERRSKRTRGLSKKQIIETMAKLFSGSGKPVYTLREKNIASKCPEQTSQASSLF